MHGALQPAAPGACSRAVSVKCKVPRGRKLQLLPLFAPTALLLQELQRELEAKAAAAAAAGAELARMRARAEEADAAEAANAAVAKDNAALRRQLDEVMLSHEAAVQSKDRARAQVMSS